MSDDTTIQLLKKMADLVAHENDLDRFEFSLGIVPEGLMLKGRSFLRIGVFEAETIMAWQILELSVNPLDVFASSLKKLKEKLRSAGAQAMERK